MSDCICPICHDEIDVAKTGRVEMSCNHSFHFKCLSSWFSKDQSEPCPMCRKEASELEGLAHPTDEEVLDALNRGWKNGWKDCGEYHDELNKKAKEPEVSLSREILHKLLRSLGGIGLMRKTEDYLYDRDWLDITKRDLRLICAANGASVISDEEWDKVVAERNKSRAESDAAYYAEQCVMEYWDPPDDEGWHLQIAV